MEKKMRAPLNLQHWIDEHRHLLKPPVGNQTIWQDEAFIVMVVGGPNQRSDYHVNSDQELFYQLEGQMCLKVIDEQGQFQDIPIKAGEIFLLPENVPHSPQREANSIGLVVEHKRAVGTKDGFQWFCQNCQSKLYEEFVHVADIVADLPPVFERYHADPQHALCSNCGFNNHYE